MKQPLLRLAPTLVEYTFLMSRLIMKTLDTNLKSRRDILNLALSSTCIPSALRAFAEEQKAIESAEYQPPLWRFALPVEELANKTPCKAARLDSHLPHGVTSKIFTERFQGALKVSTLRHLVDNGWVRHERETYKRSLGGARSNTPPQPPQNNRPHNPASVWPKHGGGAVVDLSTDGRKTLGFISNNHVVCDASRKLVDASFCNHPYDINVINQELLERNRSDPHQLPEATFADGSIHNRNIGTKKVEIYGFGKDLFHFVGYPFSFTCSMPQFGPQFQSRVLFGLRLPDGFLHSRNEIGGLSGSPVVLEGTSTVVGTVCRVYPVAHIDTPVSSVVFIGPDQVRETAREFAHQSNSAR